MTMTARPDTFMARGFIRARPICACHQRKASPDGELFWIIENGVRFTGIAGFRDCGDHNGHGGALDSWKLVHLVRHLPHLTAVERVEIGALPIRKDRRARRGTGRKRFFEQGNTKAKRESKNHSSRNERT